MRKYIHIFTSINKIAKTVVFLVSIVGVLTLSAQASYADSVTDFRSRYQPGENDLLVSLPDIPPLAYEENGITKGFLPDMLVAMDRLYQTQGVEIDKELKKGRIIIAGVYPFKRSIKYVTDGFTDFHVPYLVNPYLSLDDVQRELGITYSSAINQYGNFPLYATKEFAALLSGFEQRIGKKASQLSTQEDFTLFDDFLHQNNLTIDVDRAHTLFYPFTTAPSNASIFSLKKLASHRIDAYIHNMQECDMVLQANNIDTSNIEKIEFMKIVSRFVVPATEKGKETDKIISALVWKLQGRDASQVPREDTPYSGLQKEVPFNAYQYSEAFRNSEWFSLVGPVWEPPFTKDFK